jgi:hypothetical protein
MPKAEGRRETRATLPVERLAITSFHIPFHRGRYRCIVTGCTTSGERGEGAFVEEADGTRDWGSGLLLPKEVPGGLRGEVCPRHLNEIESYWLGHRQTEGERRGNAEDPEG